MMAAIGMFRDLIKGLLAMALAYKITKQSDEIDALEEYSKLLKKNAEIDNSKVGISEVYDETKW